MENSNDFLSLKKEENRQVRLFLLIQVFVVEPQQELVEFSSVFY